SAPSSSGPRAPPRTATPSKSAIGGTLRAKCCASASCSAERRLIAKPPSSLISSCAWESSPIATETSAGSSDTETSEPTVTPNGSGSVRTATPAGNRRIVARSSSPLVTRPTLVGAAELRVADERTLLVVRDEVELTVVRAGGGGLPVDVRRHSGADDGRPVPLALAARSIAVREEAVTEVPARVLRQEAVL